MQGFGGLHIFHLFEFVAQLGSFLLRVLNGFLAIGCLICQPPLKWVGADLENFLMQFGPATRRQDLTAQEHEGTMHTPRRCWVRMVAMGRTNILPVSKGDRRLASLPCPSLLTAQPCEDHPKSGDRLVAIVDPKGAYRIEKGETF